MRVYSVRGTLVAGDGCHIGEDQACDLADDEAAALVERGLVVPEAEAPWVLVATDWRNGGRDFKAGWIGRVSPETLRIMRAYGVGVPWPEPPQEVQPDSVFRAMPMDWTGGPLRTVLDELIFCAPEVKAFNAMTDNLHGSFALSSPSLSSNIAVALWTTAAWEERAGAKPCGVWKNASDRNQRGALAWWRSREIERLVCAMFDRLRSGEWLASGVRDDTADAAREGIPAGRWDHPRYRLWWEKSGAALRPEEGAPGALPHYSAIEVRRPTSIQAAAVAPKPLQKLAKPKPSAKALTAWMRKRVDEWPPGEPFPSEAADLAAAKAHFGEGLTRDDFRNVRHDIAPEDWRKQGPRSPANPTEA